jgi:hypothetical protein
VIGPPRNDSDEELELNQITGLSSLGVTPFQAQRMLNEPDPPEVDLEQAQQQILSDPKQVAKLASAYDILLSSPEHEMTSRLEEGRARMAQIQAEQAQETRLRQEAQKLGLPPPIPSYTQEEYDELSRLLTRDPDQMDQGKKAWCMWLRGAANSAKNRAEVIGAISLFFPLLRRKARSAGNRSGQLLERYEHVCE